MKRKKVQIDMLNPAEVRKWAVYLESMMSKNLESTIDEYVHALAKVGAAAAQEAYGSGVTVSTQKTAEGWEVKAEGSQVVFMEFGAGAWTESHELAGPALGIEIVPGSWSLSEDGAGTYQDVLDGKIAPDDYRYNRRPRNGMLKAYNAILQAQKSEATRIFK